MKRIFLVVSFLVARIFLIFSEGYSQDRGNIHVVITEGTGIIVNNDLASGRRSAISDALQGAVKHVVATLIPQKAVVNESQAIRDAIYTKRDEYVHDYRIMSEKHPQNVYSVNIKTTLSAGSIKDDLKTLGFLKEAKNRIPVKTLTVTTRGMPII